MKIVILFSVVCLALGDSDYQLAEEYINSYNNGGRGAGTSGNALVNIDTKDTKVNNAAQQSEESNIDVSVQDANAVDDSIDSSNQNLLQNDNQVEDYQYDANYNYNDLGNYDDNANFASQYGDNEAAQNLDSYDLYDTEVEERDFVNFGRRNYNYYN